MTRPLPGASGVPPLDDVGGALFGGMTRKPGEDTTAGRDLVSGAAKGAVIGAVAGDAGKGAAAEAIGSTLLGGVRRNR
jgi:hypothetical protein